MPSTTNTELTAAIEQCTSSADAWARLLDLSARNASEKTHVAFDDIDLLIARDYFTSSAISSSLASARGNFRSFGRTGSPGDIEFRKRIALAVTCQIASEYLPKGGLTKSYDKCLVESNIEKRTEKSITDTIADTIAESYHMHVPRRQLHTVCADEDHFKHRKLISGGSQTWPDCTIHGVNLNSFHFSRQTVSDELGWKWDATNECAVEPIVVKPGVLTRASEGAH